jgi:putative chitinase
MITTDQLKSIIGNIYYDIKFKVLTDSINEVAEKYSINTNLRLAHFLAQVIHESGSFKYETEIASGAEYEGRKDLGNIEPGDGMKYKGRGYIETTGRGNYKALSKRLGVDFLSNPELVGTPPYDMLSAGDFWDTHNLNSLADNDDIFGVSKAVNGINRKTGLPNGYAQRQQWLAKCKNVL